MSYVLTYGELAQVLRNRFVTEGAARAIERAVVAKLNAQGIDTSPERAEETAKCVHDVGDSAAVAAIQFALEADDGMTWLRCWNEGNFEACRREWPETPEECFIGADPLHPATRAALSAQEDKQ